ncbi:IFNL3 protein, partial [Corythaixoides concolor]|nr:IFNL3 protein [Corythaixoides concolor]
RLGFAPLLALALALGVSLGVTLAQDALEKSCSLSKYRFLLPHELKAMQSMRDHFNDIMAPAHRKCHSTLFHRRWSAAKLSVPDRVMLVEAELDLATAVLELPTGPSFAEMHHWPLAFLTQAQKDLQRCVAVEAPSHQPSGKLRHWLQRLEKDKKTETAGCLEASAIIHIFQVLDDLRCAARREQCT